MTLMRFSSAGDDRPTDEEANGVVDVARLPESGLVLGLLLEDLGSLELGEGVELVVGLVRLEPANREHPRLARDALQDGPDVGLRVDDPLLALLRIFHYLTGY